MGIIKVKIDWRKMKASHGKIVNNQLLIDKEKHINDYLVIIPKGEHLDVVLRGGGYGSLIVAGPGDGHAYTDGSIFGHAKREGDGNGNAYRQGSGFGSAIRQGSGEGNAYRQGSGDGLALRDKAGKGNAYRNGELAA